MKKIALIVVLIGLFTGTQSQIAFQPWGVLSAGYNTSSGNSRLPWLWSLGASGGMRLSTDRWTSSLTGGYTRYLSIHDVHFDINSLDAIVGIGYKATSSGKYVVEGGYQFSIFGLGIDNRRIPPDWTDFQISHWNQHAIYLRLMWQVCAYAGVFGAYQQWLPLQGHDSLIGEHQLQFGVILTIPRRSNPEPANAPQ